MKIAIINLSDYEELKYTIDAIEKLIPNIIDPQIDLFIQKELASKFEDLDTRYNINPIDLKDLKLFDLKINFDNLSYYAKTNYDIALDTQGSFKTSLITYILAGKTAGFKLNGFVGWVASLFYDEKINTSDLTKKRDMVERLLSKPFAIEI
jgi:ADP-heptose:LPS heptosyltransferase